MSHTGSRGLASAKHLLPVLKQVMFHSGILREFMVVVKLHGILLLSFPTSGVRTPRPMGLWVLGSGDDIMSYTARWSFKV